jgi:hypothetical protein
MKLIAAAFSIALMGMAGVALAAPKSDPGPPPQAQGNGPAPQAQLGPPPQAQAPAPAAAKPKTTGQHGGGKQVQAPAVQAPAQSNPGSSLAPGHEGGHRGRPAPGEVRGRGQLRANARRATHCQAARCQGEASSNGGGEQPADEGVVLGVTDERPSRDRAGRKPGEPDPGAAPEWVSVQGLNQGGGEVAYTPPESFDGALPFTGFELVLLAAIGTLLGLAGMWLRRVTA